MTPSFKLICTDLDKTFLADNGQPSRLNMQSVQRAVTAKRHFVVASGRRLPSISALYAKLGVTGDKLFFNGACIADDGDYVIKATAFAPQTVAKLLNVGQHLHLNLSLSAMDEGFEYIEPAASWIPGYLGDPRAYRDMAPLLTAYQQIPLYKVSFSGGNQADLAQAASVVQATGLAECCWTDTHYVEMTPPGITKYSSLAWLCTYRGVALREVVAFGDYENDIEMLAGVGLGVAMSNALPAVKAVANQVVNNQHHDGVGQVLEKLADQDWKG